MNNSFIKNKIVPKEIIIAIKKINKNNLFLLLFSLSISLKKIGNSTDGKKYNILETVEATI